MKSANFSYLFPLLLTSQVALATTYQMPENKGDTVVYETQLGQRTTTVTTNGETLLDIAFRNTLGQNEIVRLNPKVDRWYLKQGQVVRLPNRRILPDSPRKGITLNIAEFRMYYYPSNEQGIVESYAHGIGRQDWKTPMGQTSITRKIKDPVWHPPESIRREHAANGDPLPEVVPAGPHNPLGQHALYLNLPGEYRIHGTDVDKIYGIGMQITHGCIRMYPDDIKALFESVPVGTTVYLVKQPIKVGWLDNELYVEAHPDLEGEEMGQAQRYATAWKLIQKATGEQEPEVDQKALNQALKELDGEPVAIYERAAPLLTPDAIPAPVTGPAPVAPSAPISGPLLPTPAPVTPPTPATVPALPPVSGPVPVKPVFKTTPVEGGYYRGY